MCFELNIETVCEFQQKHAVVNRESQLAFMGRLFDGFTDGKVGRYSTFHDAAIAKYGYGSKEAIEMACLYVCF
jgi:hypothetical protein